METFETNNLMSSSLNQSDDEDIKQLELLYKLPKVQQIWQIGEILLRLKNKSNLSFHKGRDKIGITEEKAEEYILIHYLPEKIIDIGLSLKDVIEIAKSTSNQKKKLIDILDCTEENVFIKNKRFNKPKAKIYTEGIVSQIISILDEHQNNDLSKDLISELLIKRVISPQIKKNESRYFHKGRQRTFINVQYFPDLETLYPYEPLDEHGFVGLFFAMFYLLKDDKYNFKCKNATLSFNHVKYVQKPFPDAEINMNTFGKSGNIDGNMDISVEFEQDSQDYILHKHHIEMKKCDLIICWENNWVDQNMYYAPILSIKELLDTGNIVLHYSK